MTINKSYRSHFAQAAIAAIMPSLQQKHQQQKREQKKADEQKKIKELKDLENKQRQDEIKRGYQIVNEMRSKDEKDSRERIFLTKLNMKSVMASDFIVFYF